MDTRSDFRHQILAGIKLSSIGLICHATVKNIDFNIIGTYSVKNNVIEISWQNGDIHKLNYENTKSIKGLTDKNEEIEYTR